MLAQHFSNLDLMFLYVRVFLCNKLLCLIETYMLHELDKHIGTTSQITVKWESDIYLSN